jgi:hypothetical protein
MCVLILTQLYVSAHTTMCVYTIICESSYYYVCVHNDM